jgi:hypothetical protein
MGLAGLALVAACSKSPAPSANAAAPQAAAPQAAAPPTATPQAAAAPASGPAVSGVFTGDGKQAALTEVTAHHDDPFDGKPIIAVVFTTKDQGADATAATDALFGNFGDAIVIKLEPDGTVIGADVIHSGLQAPGSVSIGGIFVVKDFSNANGQISGHLTSNGPTDVFDHKLNVDLTFHTKAP